MIQLKRQLSVGVFSVLLVLFLSTVVSGQIIRTASEQVGFQEYTSYDEMMQYLQDIQATSTEMLLSNFGKTIEGRVQPYAIFSRPLVTQPKEAIATGKPVVVLAANIHGGERTIRESLLLLARELVTIGHPMNELLDDMIIVMVPSINPDGFVRGSRTNSVGIDMNRDYVKLEQPALQNFVQNILHTWYPHVILDGHNGGAFPFNVTYQGPPHAASDQRLTEVCDLEIFPLIDEEMEKNGYRSFYYYGRGDSSEVHGMPFDVRLNTAYGGLMNSITILFESPGQDREDGARGGLVATKAILKYVLNNSEKVLTMVNRARRETIEMGQNATGDIPVQMTTGPKSYKVSYEKGIIPGGQREGETRQEANSRRQIVTINNVDLMLEPVVTKTRPRPYAYVLEARAFRAIEMLKRHRLTIEVLQRDTEIDVEAYNMTGIEYRSEYDHPASVVVTFADETVKSTRTFPKGTFVIRTGQVMGRLVTHMLEPETNDNVVKWNAMDALLPSAPRQRGQRGGIPQVQQQPQPRIFPIFKIMRPESLPTKILKY
ncbi:M14 family zinc carboxypeptidase [candidate division KSB1 bacterium]